MIICSIFNVLYDINVVQNIIFHIYSQKNSVRVCYILYILLNTVENLYYFKQYI